MQQPSSAYPFPDDFVWGAATASYQVEGAANDDGRGLSIWDTFSHSPGHVLFDHTGDVACDQYHRYKDDVQLMNWLGLKAYRFSVSWPRVLPKGYGEVNEKGLDYYERLVDELLRNGIQPYMTLFHWDLPEALQQEFGGWESRETAKCFADYAGHVMKRLGDRVKHVFTINEFVCFTDKGYFGLAEFAPGKRLSVAERNQVRHNGLLAHGLAVRAIRAVVPPDVKVGLAENAEVCCPVIETDEHIAAARSAMRHVNAPFLTAVMEGRYLDSYLDEQGDAAPVVEDGDMEIIASPLDFVGLNMYAPLYVRAEPSEPAGYARVEHPASYPRHAMPWLYHGPQITYWGPRHMKEIWDVDHVVISENGCAADDRMSEDGEIYDTDRVMYLRNHLIYAQRCVREGWPLKGYLLWSLLDNFEWACGYTKRFGITYVNYETLERTPKLSAKFYRACIEAGGVV